MVNINDPFQQHQCCKEQDNIGVYFQAMGAQQFSCSFILRLGTLGNQGNIVTKVLGTINIQKTMHLITKIWRLLSTKTCGLLAKIKTFFRPYGSYQELKWSPNPKKFFHITTSIRGIDEGLLQDIYQKRLGTALNKLNEKKGISGKGRLRDSTIDKLQNYYGIAIRSNSVNLPAMKSAIHASLFHCTSSADRKLHLQHCSQGANSWCRC